MLTPVVGASLVGWKKVAGVNRREPKITLLKVD